MEVDPSFEEERRRLHSRILTKANDDNCKHSELKDRFSRHEFEDTLSFASMSSFHAIVKDFKKSVSPLDFVGSSGTSVVYSVRYNASEVGSYGSVLLCSEKRGKKRAREEDEPCELNAKVRKAVSSLRASSLGKATREVETEAACSILTRFLGSVRGSANEHVVDSWGLFARHFEPISTRPAAREVTGSSAPVPRVVIAIRLHGGVAVSVAAIKRALGPCWADGMVTTQETETSGIHLPSSEASQASQAFGNKPLLIVTSIPRLS